MSDIYDVVWLRRWSISTIGQAECVEDAVNITLVSHEDRAAIEAKNADIYQAITYVSELEAARLVPEPGEEISRTYRVYDEPTVDGETGDTVEHWHMESRPEWVSWDAAQATISEAGDTILALERIRKGEPQLDDPGIVANTWGYVVRVTVLPELPDLWPADFKALLEISGYKDELFGWIDQIADPIEKAFARSRFESSAMYNRYDPLLLAGQQAIGISDEELNMLWSWAAT